MTRDQMITMLIQAWSPPEVPHYSPFYTDEEWADLESDYLLSWDRKLEDWTRVASLNWLDELIGLILDPPELSHYRDQFVTYWQDGEVSHLDGTIVGGKIWDQSAIDGSVWSNQLVEALAVWGRRDSDFVLGRIGPLLNQKRGWETLLKVVAAMNAGGDFRRKHDCLYWLRHPVERAAELNDAEIYSLGSALCSVTGDEARRLLLDLRHRVSHLTMAVVEKLDRGIVYQAKISDSTEVEA